MHRSSSTPCLSPTGRDVQQRDQSGPIEILGNSCAFAKTRLLVKEIVKAIKNGVEPLPVHTGLGGGYFFRNSRGESVAIVKAIDEEPFAPNNPKGFFGKALGQPGLKPSVRVGETGFREVAAYVLDYDHFANVPATALVKITHSIFNVNDGVNGDKLHSKKKLVSKIAPFQQFIPHDFDASDHGTSSFPVAAVHRIGILDIRIFNTDRHAGNLLVRKLDGGIRKVKVNQVKKAENFMPVSMGDTYTRVISNAVSTDHAFSKAEDSCIAMGGSFNGGDDHMMSLSDSFNREDNNFISMGQPFNKVESNSLSVSHPFCKDESNITMLSQSFSREDDSTISASHSFKDNNTAISMGQSFSNDDSNITSICQTLSKVADTNPPMSHCYSRVNDNTISVSQTYSKIENNNLSMSQSFGRGESNIISFGGFNDDDDINSAGKLICSYDLLMSQSSGQQSDIMTGKRLVESNADTVTSATQMAGNKEVISKKEEQKAAKKPPSNSFPSNVRSLLSTGRLDGVSVKYIAWSREKELRGIIKGSGYLCSCQSCNFSKAINAYEFERHAGCKTKHPNNHIYFENGKTIYGIVQELRNTPRDLLFEVIQTITGSSINQKSFRIWKESFLAATRELQRIYGKDDVRRLS